MGGTCMAPNICLCPHGYSGKNCEIGKFKTTTKTTIRLYETYNKFA